MTDAIVKTVLVNASPEAAFDIFVTRIASWWPLEGHAVSAAQGKPALAVTIEPRVGGAVYETMFDGARSDWGKVLVFEAGERFVMSWHPGTDADKATRVEVTFAGQGAGQTLVTLTHSGWHIWAEEAQEKRANYDKGWDFVLGERFASCMSN